MSSTTPKPGPASGSSAKPAGDEVDIALESDSDVPGLANDASGSGPGIASPSSAKSGGGAAAAKPAKPTLPADLVAPMQVIWDTVGREVGALYGPFKAGKDQQLKGQAALDALTPVLLKFLEGDPTRKDRLLARLEQAAFMRLLIDELDKRIKAAKAEITTERDAAIATAVAAAIAALPKPKKPWWNFERKQKAPKPAAAPKAAADAKRK